MSAGEVGGAVSGDRRRAIEKTALSVSIYANLFNACLGIGFAWATDSEAILFDGMFSLVALAMAIVARRIALAAETPYSPTFQYGKAHLEPWVNAIRCVVILAIGTLALLSAISALLHDGRPVEAGLGIVYALTASASCLLVGLYVRRAARRSQSPTLKVDYLDWVLDGAISLSVALAFTLAFWLETTPYAAYADYVDPAIVTVIVLLVLPVPVLRVWENAREMLLMAPLGDVGDRIGAALDAALEGLPVTERRIRLTKVGRFHFLVVYILLPEDHPVGRIAELDTTRAKILAALEPLPERINLEVLFLGRADWLDGIETSGGSR